MELLERINELVSTTEKSVRSFANKIGVPQPSVNYYLKGERKIPFDFIEAILKTYPDVSAEWLLRGTGSMYASDERDTDKEEMPSIGMENYRKLLDEMEQMKNKLNDLENKVG